MSDMNAPSDPSLTSRTPSGRIKVDVRVLPKWQQYVLALAIVFFVLTLVVLSWQRGNAPDPTWMYVFNTYILPYAGVIGVLAIVFLVVRHLMRRKTE